MSKCPSLKCKIFHLDHEYYPIYTEIMPRSDEIVPPTEHHKFDVGQEEVAGPQAASQSQLEPDLGKAVLRKLDRSFLPIVIGLCMLLAMSVFSADGCTDLCSFLDRSNIGNAQLAGMGKSLKFSRAQYQWLLTIFYICYILLEWGALMWKVVPPHIWTCACVASWGLAATLQSATQEFAGMMVCRFFLAAAEAMHGPGIPFLLSFFYMRNELGLRSGIFLSAAPFATCFASALAYGITSGHSKLQSWRLLFLVEGLPTLFMAVVAFFFLPDHPGKCRSLTPAEKDFAKAQAVR